MVTYYRRLSSSKERQRAEVEAKNAAAAAAAAGGGAPPKRKWISRRQQEKLLLVRFPACCSLLCSIRPAALSCCALRLCGSFARWACITAAGPLLPTSASLSLHPAWPQQSTNYDEARVQRLRKLQLAAAEELKRGVAPPVQGTAIFPPGVLLAGSCLLLVTCLQCSHTAGGIAAGTARKRLSLVAVRCSFALVCTACLHLPLCPAGNEDGPCVGTGPPGPGAVAAVVVVTFNRCVCGCWLALCASDAVGCGGAQLFGAVGCMGACARDALQPVQLAPPSLHSLTHEHKCPCAEPSTWSRCWSPCWQCTAWKATTGEPCCCDVDSARQDGMGGVATAAAAAPHQLTCLPCM